MSEGFEARFYAAVNDFINTETDSSGERIKSERVTYIESDTVTDGYCDTCWYERTVLEISYVDAATGRSRLYTYDGDFGALIRELT